MNDQLEHLQELNSLLADYAKSLTAAAGDAPLTPAARDALRQVYDLQATVARRIHELLDAEVEAPATPKPRRMTKPDPTLLGFRKIVRQTKLRRHEGIEEIIAHRNFSEGMGQIHTILRPAKLAEKKRYTMVVLGPNEFPDDPKPKPKGRPG